jgi:hypothetical protein
MKRVFFCLLIACCAACNLKEQEKINAKTYFDLAGYFNQEATRLTKKDIFIDKTVVVNNQTESKKIKVNWLNEFNSFISSDINKDSWKGSFKIIKNDNLNSYLADNDKIPVKKIEIGYRNQKVAFIKIFVVNTNSLYTSKDSLSYYPDSLYEIKKTQQIKLMSKKEYRVTGKLK